MSELDKLPGVELRDGHFRVPKSAWQTALYYDFIETLYDMHVQRVTGTSSPIVSSLPVFGGFPWTPIRPLYPHQTEAVQLLLDNGGGLLCDEMGLGKTATAIVAAERIAKTEGPHRPRIIIAPKYTRAVWLRELLTVGAIRTNLDFEYAEGLDTVDGKAWNWDAKWWFVHYQLADKWANRLAVNPRGKPVVAIIDEIHWIKNGRAKRSKGTSALAGLATSRIGLTGTPIANRPSELWFPLSVIDGHNSWGSPVDFRRRYCGAFHDGHGWQDGEPTHTDELVARMGSSYIRRLTKDVTDLPPMQRQTLLVDMDDAAKEKTELIVNQVGADRVLNAILHNQMGEDTLRAINQLRTLTSDLKLKTTVQHCMDILESGQSVVVFTWRRKTAEKIQDMLRNAWEKVHGLRFANDPEILVVHGGFDQDYRDEEVELFQESQPGGALIATLDSLKEGVTLTRANHVVLHDLSWVPSDILQAEARVYRIGQDKHVMSYWVLAEESIDVMIARCLLTKADQIAATLGITAPKQAAEELGLLNIAAIPSVEEEMDRLIDDWLRVQLEAEEAV